MGFNKRKMEDERRAAAQKEAAARRATDKQILEDAERLIAAWNERQAKRMHVVLAHNRRRHHGAALVSMGALPRLPDHDGDRFAQDRSPS